MVVPWLPLFTWRMIYNHVYYPMISMVYVGCDQHLLLYSGKNRFIYCLNKKKLSARWGKIRHLIRILPTHIFSLNYLPTLLALNSANINNIIGVSGNNSNIAKTPAKCVRKSLIILLSPHINHSHTQVLLRLPLVLLGYT